MTITLIELNKLCQFNDIVDIYVEGDKLCIRMVSKVGGHTMDFHLPLKYADNLHGRSQQ